MWLGVFILGMILNGIGGTTLYSVGVVFLDNSVSPRTFPLYQGKYDNCRVAWMTFAEKSTGKFFTNIIINTCNNRRFSLQSGFLYSASILGPAVGYLLGGYFVGSLYVDFDKVDADM